MRRKIVVSSIIPLLFLLTLGGCLGPDYLVTSIGPSAAEESANLREGEPHYTSHRPAAAKPEIVRIAIDDQFTLYERAKILRAANEWNHVLNGFVRFDIDPAADKEPVWIIVPVRGGRPPPVSGMIIGTLLGTAFRWWGLKKWVFPQAGARPRVVRSSSERDPDIRGDKAA